jgi:hypothetical protein
LMQRLQSGEIEITGLRQLSWPVDDNYLGR